MQVTVYFQEIYKGIPRFGELDQYIVAKGFRLYSLARVSWKTENAKFYANHAGTPIYGLALYLMPPDLLLERAKTDLDNSQSSLRRAVNIGLIYNALDYVEECLELFPHGEDLSKVRKQVMELGLSGSSKRGFFQYLRSRKSENKTRSAWRIKDTLGKQ